MLASIAAWIAKQLAPIIFWLIVGAVLVAVWDRRAPGSHLWFIPLSPSLAAQRDGYAADYATERASFVTMHDAFTVENAAVLSLGATGARWQAASQAAEAKAITSNAWRLQLAQKIAATPPPADTSELGLCRAADQLLIEGAQ